jgi:hypothetical protein
MIALLKREVGPSQHETSSMLTTNRKLGLTFQHESTSGAERERLILPAVDSLSIFMPLPLKDVKTD